MNPHEFIRTVVTLWVALMKKQCLVLASLLVLTPGLVYGCASNETPEAEAPIEEPAIASADESASGEPGTLAIYANGEDFVRQGFVTKDGWEISFDHLYVNLADVTAYQTDPPYDPDAAESLQAKEQVSLDQAKTVDLAEGDENAEPVLVGEIQAPPGQYNALSWSMVEAGEGVTSEYPLVLQGTATKDGRTIDFTLNLDQALAFQCGEFVGDERKGILEPGGEANLEATFHFDHLFGDGEAPADDPINTGALGFEPLASLAEGDQLEVDTASLEEQLPAEDYQMLKEILPSLGHVGEGHCAETMMTT